MVVAAWVLLFCINDFRQPMLSAQFGTSEACNAGAKSFIAKINSDNIAAGGGAQPTNIFTYVCAPSGENQ